MRVGYSVNGAGKVGHIVVKCFQQQSQPTMSFELYHFGCYKRDRVSHNFETVFRKMEDTLRF